MKYLLIMTFAMLCMTTNNVVAQSGGYVTSADKTYGDGADSSSEEGTPPMTPEEIEELKKNRYKIVKMTSDEDTIVATDNIAVDLFVLRTFVTAATAVEISDGLLMLNDVLEGKTDVKIEDFVKGNDFKKLTDNLKLQATNVADLAPMSADALKGAKAEPNLARKAKLMFAVNPTVKLSKLIISETKKQSEMMKKMSTQLSAKNIKLKL